MSSTTLTTIVKMVESLPDELQEQVAENIREFIAELEDDARWKDLFKQTQPNLVAAARKAKEAISAGKATPIDYEQL